MSSLLKIALGALATIVLSWLMYGPMGFGARCAAAAGSASAGMAAGASADGDGTGADAAGAASAAVTAASEPPASVAAVANCQAEVNGLIANRTVNFDSGGAAISAASLPLVDELANSLKDCAGTAVEVAGHTDAVGDAGANQRLSEARATAVVAALAERGVPRDRLTGRGYGETRPVVRTEAAEVRNRRIEFSVASNAPPAVG